MFWKGKYGPLLIAEIGGNHEGNIEYAHKLLDLAINSKVDVIKFQIYNPENLVNKDIDAERFCHFKRFTLKPHEHIELAKKCLKSNKIYLASVWDIESILWIDYFTRYYKIGSGDLTAYQIIERLTKTKKPLILSTGLSNYNQISNTIKFIQSKDPIYKKSEMIALLQCTSNYPNPEDETNLEIIKEFKDRFPFSVGYSDHTKDLNALILAAALGAEILEFHFTDSRDNKTFRDHAVSLTSDEIDILIEKIQRNQILIGNHKKELTKSELRSEHHLSFRRSLYAKKDIHPGEKFSNDNIISLRPKIGVCASNILKVIGRKSSRMIHKLDPIQDYDLNN